MDSHEYSIFAQIACQIFDKCFEEIGINSPERGWPAKLMNAIDERFPDNDLNAKAIRELYKRITDRAAEGTFSEITITESTLELLAKFANIDNYKALDRTHNGLSVVYTPKPFRFLNLLRVCIKGYLSTDTRAFTFTSDDHIELKNITVTDPILFRMPGDHSAQWVKITYVKDDVAADAYFALSDPAASNTAFLSPQKLITFFNRTAPGQQ